MALTKSAISLIGRIHPEIFDLLGNPDGPYLVSDRLAKVGLNPQPLPPREVPVGLTVGYLAGVELVKLSFTAARLRVGFEIDPDDWCPTPPRRPKFPPIPWPPIPWPRTDRDEGDTWTVHYPVGLALALELSQHSWEGLEVAEGLNGILEQALGNAQESLG